MPLIFTHTENNFAFAKEAAPHLLTYTDKPVPFRVNSSKPSTLSNIS
jgi:hypothetical protein